MTETGSAASTSRPTRAVLKFVIATLVGDFFFHVFRLTDPAQRVPLRDALKDTGVLLTTLFPWQRLQRPGSCASLPK